MNRHSMKKALIVPFLVITVTAIIIVGLSFFFNQWLAFISCYPVICHAHYQCLHF